MAMSDWLPILILTAGTIGHLVLWYFIVRMALSHELKQQAAMFNLTKLLKGFNTVKHDPKYKDNMTYDQMQDAILTLEFRIMSGQVSYEQLVIAAHGIALSGYYPGGCRYELLNDEEAGIQQMVQELIEQVKPHFKSAKKPKE